MWDSWTRGRLVGRGPYLLPPIARAGRRMSAPRNSKTPSTTMPTSGTGATEARRRDRRRAPAGPTASRRPTEAARSETSPCTPIRWLKAPSARLMKTRDLVAIGIPAGRLAEAAKQILQKAQSESADGRDSGRARSRPSPADYRDDERWADSRRCCSSAPPWRRRSRDTRTPHTESGATTSSRPRSIN